MKQVLSLAARALLISALFSSPAAMAQRDATQPLPQDIGADPGHLPKVHYIATRLPQGKYPFWVDSSMLLKSDGSINAPLLSAESQHLIQVVLTKPTEHGCVQAGANGEDLTNAPDRSSIEEATKTARLVILGRVTEKSYGLSIDVFGQMLRVEPQETLKGQPRSVPAYFVFMPVGNVKVGSTTVCKTDIRYPPPPEIGDQVLLFAPNDPDWEANQTEPYLELLDDGGLVTIHPDLTVSEPKRFEHSNTKASVSKREDILARVRSAAKWENH